MKLQYIIEDMENTIKNKEICITELDTEFFKRCYTIYDIPEKYMQCDVLEVYVSMEEVIITLKDITNIYRAVCRDVSVDILLYDVEDGNNYKLTLNLPIYRKDTKAIEDYILAQFSRDYIIREMSINDKVLKDRNEMDKEGVK